MSSPISTARTDLNRLAGISGRVVTPHDSDYDRTRAVYYGGIEKRPAAIVRVAGVDDVRRVIAAARDGGHELAIRSGGHSIVGHSTTDAGLVIDLRDMSRIAIDAEERRAWVETGATALQVTAALAPHGLAIGFGDSGSVGVGGITLAGGIGFLVRKFGMTIDSVLAAEVVTADGRVHHVDARHEPELFWAIRGGGGNFGVVTRLEFRLNPLPHFTGGLLVLPATAETIAGFVAAAQAAPDELSTIANVMPAPPLPFLPPAQHGQLVILALMAFAGAGEAATRAIAPFRSLATPLADMVKAGPYVGMYPPEDHSQPPTAVNRTMFTNAVDLETARTIHDYLSRPTAAPRVVQLRVLGGAMARVPATATAFAHRSKPILINVAAVVRAEADREANRVWVTEFAKAIQPRDEGAYVGFLTDDGPDRIRSAYPNETWHRLSAIKAMYDPTNLFRLNQNVPPIGRAS